MQKGGFFNSTDHDRRYSASDFNQLIDTIKSDGIDQYGDKLQVIAGEGLNVIVKSGKAFYDQHWLFNDANLTLELEQASPTQDRIDAIIIEVNETDRTMLIKAVTGEPSDTPVAPALVETTNIHQYYLAWVEVDTGSLVVGTITDKRTQWADIKSSLQERASNLVNSLATVESSNVASHNYDVGDYLTMNGVLYKVAVAITQGDTLVAGTNITSTDTGTELVGAINSAKASAINLATIEATNISSQAYSIGEYLVYNGLLYKVTSAIAQGDTLQVGTNIEQTKVGNELSRLDSFILNPFPDIEYKFINNQLENSSISGFTLYEHTAQLVHEEGDYYTYTNPLEEYEWINPSPNDIFNGLELQIVLFKMTPKYNTTASSEKIIVQSELTITVNDEAVTIPININDTHMGGLHLDNLTFKNTNDVVFVNGNAFATCKTFTRLKRLKVSLRNTTFALSQNGSSSSTYSKLYGPSIRIRYSNKL